MDPVTLTLPCQELNRSALTAAAAGHPEEVESRLSSALADGASRFEPACGGLILRNVAAFSQVSGHFAEAERFAQRSVNTLEAVAGPKDPVLLRPLQILASAKLEQGKLGQARKVYGRMQLIPADQPGNRALVHGLAAIMLEIEQNYAGAEKEYREALIALEQAGRGNTADAASTLLSLGSLSIREGKLAEADQILDRCLAVFQAATDTAPLDRIKALYIRATLRARQGQWQRAEEELRDVIALADQQRELDAGFHSFLLTNYAKALRKNHHRREAGLVEAHVASLGRPAGSGGLVDVTEFSVLSKKSKR